MANFPNAAFDDDVDSTTQALNYLIGRGDSMGIFEYYRRLAEKAKAEKTEAEKAPSATVRLRVPHGVGGCMIGGSMLTTDETGIVDVPLGFASELLAAGWTRAGVQ